MYQLTRSRRKNPYILPKTGRRLASWPGGMSPLMLGLAGHKLYSSFLISSGGQSVHGKRTSHLMLIPFSGLAESYVHYFEP